MSKLKKDFKIWKVSLVEPAYPFIFLPLNLIKKYNDEFYKIYYLSYSPERSINDSIVEEYFNIKYIIFNNIININKTVGRHAIILKKYLRYISKYSYYRK